jgi:hypothetical protein
MSEINALEWLCANIDMTNIRARGRKENEPFRVIKHTDNGVEVLHTQTGEVRAFTARTVRTAV